VVYLGYTESETTPGHYKIHNTVTLHSYTTLLYYTVTLHIYTRGYTTVTLYNYFKVLLHNYTTGDNTKLHIYVT